MLAVNNVKSPARPGPAQRQLEILHPPLSERGNLTPRAPVKQALRMGGLNLHAGGRAALSQPWFPVSTAFLH